MSRSGQKFVAWLSLGALLFLQLAVAAYACPPQSQDGRATLAAGVPMLQPCHGIDAEQPKLCEQHCVQAAQSSDTQPHSVVIAPVLPLIAILSGADLHLAAKYRAERTSLSTVVDPPPLIRYGVLRI